MTESHTPRTRWYAPAQWLALMLVLWLTLWPGLAAAQTAGPTGAPAIANATLQVWPEYDDPGVLVIMAGTFGGNLQYPLRVSFPLPEGARDIQATTNDPERGLLSQEWQLEGGSLSYDLPGPAFHIEYYLNRPPSSNQRDLAYTFQVPYPISQLSVEVKQPARSTGFTLTPEAQNLGAGQDGLVSYRLARQDLKPGDSIAVTIRYTKSDQTPSLPKNQVAPSAPVPAAADPVTVQPWTHTVLPWIAIGAGIALLAGAGGYWLWLQNKARKPAPGRVRRLRTPVVERSAGDDAGQSAAFCPKCGRRYRSQDVFCGQCGAPRRR